MAKKHKSKVHPKRPAPGRSRPGVSFSAILQLLKNNLPIIRFVVITLVSLAGFFLLRKIPWVKATLIDRYTDFVAASSRVFLKLFGLNTAGTGTAVMSDTFAVTIAEVCNGLEVTAIFFAAVLGFPASWKHKLIGLAIGYPVIYIVNLGRIAVLFFLGANGSPWFDTVHYYYAQAFVILVTVITWFVWMSLYSDYGSKSHQVVSH